MPQVDKVGLVKVFEAIRSDGIVIMALVKQLDVNPGVGDISAGKKGLT